jgi:ribosome biogenesis GTPase
VLNKVDLDPEAAKSPELAVYPPLGVPVFPVSAREGAGIDELARALCGTTSALLGPSGAGKTSLLNRLVPRAGAAVQDVSERTGKGKHTTTWVEMLPLPGGGWLVDSPGLRALDLSLVHPEDLAGHFPEIARAPGHCRFPDCRHLGEPGCRVKEALAQGRIAPHRYDSYERILRSLERGEG